MVRVKMPGEPARPKVKPKPFRPKVKEDAPPQKPLKITDRVQPEPKRKDMPKGKGKKVVIASPHHSSDDDGQEFYEKKRSKKEEAAENVVLETLKISKDKGAKKSAQKVTAAKLTPRPAREVSELGKEPSKSPPPSISTTTVPQASVPSDATEEDFTPPEGYVTAPINPTDKARFDSYFCKRKICPAIYIDLEHMKTELKLDLSQFLTQYKPWIENHLSFSPSIVKEFYCNLKPLDVVDKEGEVLEARLETSVRGQKLELSAKNINKWLGIENPPEDGFVERSNKEVLLVLKPEGDPKGLNFKPSSMSEQNRILWYIYSRVIVNKGNNFTSFTRRDYSVFASFVAKDVRNLGSMIMTEISLFREHALTSISLPFPHLISLFLKMNKIWYVEPSDEIVRVPRFGKTQLSKMGIIVATSDGEGEVKVRRKRRRPEIMDEVQSTRAPTPEPPATLEQIVKNVVREALGTILSSHLHMMEQHKKEMLGLFKLIDAGNTAVMELLRTQIENTRDLSERLKAFEALLPTPQHTPSPQPSHPTHYPSSSQPIQPDPEPHPFTHNISPKLPSPPTSSGHPSPSHSSIPSSPVPAPVSQHDIIIDQVLTSLGQEYTIESPPKEKPSETSIVPPPPPERPFAVPPLPSISTFCLSDKSEEKDKSGNNNKSECKDKSED